MFMALGIERHWKSNPYRITLIQKECPDYDMFALGSACVCFLQNAGKNCNVHESKSWISMACIKVQRYMRLNQGLPKLNMD